MSTFKRLYEAVKSGELKIEPILESTTTPILESVRKVGSHENGNKKATVHKDSDIGEYHVKFHTDGKHHKDADYHTDDVVDANGTAKHWVGLKNKVNEGVIVEDAGNASHPVHKVAAELRSAGFSPKVSRNKDGSHSVHTDVIDSKRGAGEEPGQNTSKKFHAIVGKHQDANRSEGHDHSQAMGVNHKETDRHSLNTMHFTVKSKHDE